MLRMAACLAFLLVAACTTTPKPSTGPGPGGPPPPPPPPPPSGTVLPDWRAIIRPAELGRLDRLNDAWLQALREARAYKPDAVHGLGDLINPEAAQPGVTPPVGDYRCRTIKLGAKSDGMLAFVQYGWFKCRITQTPKGLKLAKVSGSQRPSGLLFPDTGKRMILLGSISVGNEAAANSYGLHPDRDIVGVLERLDERRWRLAMPWPYLESNLDLIELEKVG